MIAMKFNPDRMPGVLAGEVRFTTRLMKPQPFYDDISRTWYIKNYENTPICQSLWAGFIKPKYKPGEVYPIAQTNDVFLAGWESSELSSESFDMFLLRQPRVKILTATPKQLKDITEDEAELAGYEAGFNAKLGYNLDAVDEYQCALFGIYPEATDESWAWCYEIELQKGN